MFRSAQDALRFAYRTVNTPIVKMSSIGTMRAPDRRDLGPVDKHGNGDAVVRVSGGGGMSELVGLSRHELLAQAAIILSLVERSVDVYGMAYIKAYYGYEIKHGGPQKSAVLSTLTTAAMSSLPTGMHNRRGVSRMVEVYFGAGYSMISLRADLKCNNRRYYEYKQWIGDVMDRIASRTEEDVYRALESAGLILAKEAA